MNKSYVEITGRAGQEPQRIGIGKAAPVKLSVATTQRWRDSSGKPQERTDWHSVFFWERVAESAMAYVRKGSPVLVSGTLTSRQYETKDGDLHTVWEIHARELLVLALSTASADSETADAAPSPSRECP